MPLDEDAGATASDYSGNHNNFAITQGTWTTGAFGNALSFNASGNALNSSVSLPFNAAFTVSLWVNPRDNSNEFLLGRVTNSSWYVEFYSGKLHRWQTGGTALDWVWINIPYTINEWQHLTLVYDGAKKLIYYNGALAASTTQASTSGTGLYLAKNAGYAWGLFNGTIDEFRIYDYAMNSAEVSALYLYDPSAITDEDSLALGAIALILALSAIGLVMLKKK